MDFEDHDEDLDLPPEGFDYAGNSSRFKMANSGGGEIVISPQQTKPIYRECLKNHAVGIGGHAVDGCGEFLAAGEDGSLDALKCAACKCHRNFHRKEVNGGSDGSYHHHSHFHPHNQHPQFSPFYRTPPCYLHLPPHSRPLALPSTSGGDGGGGGREDQEGFSNPSGGDGGGDGGGGGGGGGSRKRFRTKFTVEQKDKMLNLAETLGWRIQKHDEIVVQQFCNEMGIKRHVFKVWMHNNKHTLGKKP